MTRMDFSNALWAFSLAKGTKGILRFHFGGKLWNMLRPLRKFSLALCQFLLDGMIKDIVAKGFLLIN